MDQPTQCCSLVPNSSLLSLHPYCRVAVPSLHGEKGGVLHAVVIPAPPSLSAQPSQKKRHGSSQAQERSPRLSQFRTPICFASDLHYNMSPTNQPTQEQLDEWKEAFSLYDKKGNSTVSSANLGDLLRGLGQNPTQAEVRELVKSVGGSERQEVDIDFGTFLTILTRPDGFKPAGSAQEFIQGFQVFDKEGDGYISAAELRYVLTNLAEKLTDEEVDELLKEVQIGQDGRINYVDFVTLILSN